MKTISVRLEDGPWLKAKQKMLLDGESFQGLFDKAILNYIKEEGKMVTSLIEKEILTPDETQEVLDSEEVLRWEDNGYSGKYPGLTWYTVEHKILGEKSIYCEEAN